MSGMIQQIGGNLLVALIALAGSLCATVFGAVNAGANRRLNLQLDGIKTERDEKLAALQGQIEVFRDKQRMRMEINQQNWKQLLEDLRPFGQATRNVIEALRRIASEGHKVPDESVLEESQTILKYHREFREKMKPLWGQIRKQDYDRLEEMYKFHMEVILDIALNQEERRARVARMADHVTRLDEESRHVERLLGYFLRPRWNPPPDNSAVEPETILQ